MISAKSPKNKITAHVELFSIYVIWHNSVYFSDVFRLSVRAKKRAKKRMDGKKLNSIYRHFFFRKVAWCQTRVPGTIIIHTSVLQRKVHSTSNRWYIASATRFSIKVSKPVYLR